MDTSTSSKKPTSSSTTGKPKGKPEQIGKLVGELGSGEPTSTSEKALQTALNASRSQQLSEVIHRFYKALKAIYGSKFDMQFSTAREVDESKVMWGEDITALNVMQLKACLVNAKRMIRAGHKDYAWPNIGLILGFIDLDKDWERQAHKPYVPPERLIEDLTAKDKRIKTGNDTITDLKGLFK